MQRGVSPPTQTTPGAWSKAEKVQLPDLLFIESMVIPFMMMLKNASPQKKCFFDLVPAGAVLGFRDILV